MTIEHVVATNTGVLVSFAGNSLGYTRDGVRIRIEPRWGDVMSDDWGGEGGAPADTQILGEIATVTLDFTKYDKAFVQQLTSFSKNGSAGLLPAIGTLIRQDSEFGILILAGSIETWTFPVAFPREAYEVNKGTKFSTANVGFECWRDAPGTPGKLFTV